MEQQRIAWLSLELDAAVPEEAHLLPPGPFRASDGRPHDVAGWMLDAKIAQQVIDRAAAKKTDTLIDYEHQSLHTEWNGQPAPAAGWFRELAWRDSGLHAVGVKWSDRARQMIAAREYRYISAVFSYLPSGEVLEIISVALTNTPALDGLEALVAARSTRAAGFSLDRETKEETIMADDAKLAALTQARDNAVAETAALKTVVATLTAERDTAVADLVALKTKIQADAEAAAQAAEQAARAAALKEALEAGVITPAERDALVDVPLATLKKVLDAHPKSALLTRQSDDKGNPRAALTKEEADAAAAMGVTPEQFAKAKEA